MTILITEHKSIDNTAQICCYSSAAQLLIFLQMLLQHVYVMDLLKKGQRITIFLPYHGSQPRPSA